MTTSTTEPVVDGATRRRRTGVYVALLSVAALAVLVGDVRVPDLARLPIVAVWLLATIAAERLWLETLTGEGTVTVASTFNFAAIFLLPRTDAVLVVATSAAVAIAIFQRRGPVRTVFGFAHLVLVVWLASLAFGFVAGKPATIESFWHVRILAAYLTAGAVFFVTNTMAVTGAISISQGEPFWAVWWRNFAYAHEAIESLALLTISPILVATYLAVGPPSFVLFFLPLFLIWNGNRNYIELRRTQDSIVAAERLAAKGEMAAGIAHELNNYLGALRGGAQLMERQVKKAGLEGVGKRLQLIREQVDNMALLTRGLMEFAHREVALVASNLAELVEKTVTFLEPQNRFDGMSIRTEVDPSVEPTICDAAQIQQVLVNFLTNAADATRAREGAEPVIVVRLTPEKRRRSVRLSVTDNGVGMTPEVRHRVFEPTFTTKPDGHGFGLSTCHRIAENHGGRLEIETEPGRGSTISIVLPSGGPPKGTPRVMTRSRRAGGGG